MYFFAFKDFVKDMLAKTTIIYKGKKKTLQTPNFPQASTDRFNLPQHAVRREGEDKSTMNMTCVWGKQAQ